MKMFLPLSFLLLAGPEPAAISLPKPPPLSMPLGEAIARRHSTRKFDPKREVTREELSALLQAAAGITRPDPAHPQGGRRAAPAAFEAYAVDVIVTSKEGTFLYSPRDHSLKPLATPGSKEGAKDLRGEIPRSDWVKEAPLLVILAADTDRYPASVRAERRPHYAHADAAAIAENLHLAATALGLGSCITADAKPEASALLAFKESQRAVFIVPVGKEAEAPPAK